MTQVYFDEDVIWMTTSKYELFRSYGKIGMDAYLLYSHLQYTARKQHTNSVWANNVYIRDGLYWTKQRLQKAKNLLKDLDLIREIRDRNDKGQLGKPYIIIKTKTSPFEIDGIKNQGVENPPVDNQAGGNRTANALTSKEMLKQGNKCLNSEASENSASQPLNYKKDKEKEKTPIPPKDNAAPPLPPEDKHTELRKRVIDDFCKGYEKLTGQKLNITKTCIGQINKAMKLGGYVYDPIGFRMSELFKKSKDDTKGFWTFTPAKLVWGWNELVSVKPEIKRDIPIKKLGDRPV